MKRRSPKPIDLLRSRTPSFAKASRSAIAVLSVLIPCGGLAQTQVRHSSPAQKKASEGELDKRLAAAAAARDSGDPAAAQLANERLIATALSELARLRMAEQAYPQAVELFTSSLQFEDVPGTRLDLGTAEIQASKFEDAIKQAKQVLAADPNDLRATRVLASALTQ